MERNLFVPMDSKVVLSSVGRFVVYAEADGIRVFLGPRSDQRSFRVGPYPYDQELGIISEEEVQEVWSAGGIREKLDTEPVAVPLQKRGSPQLRDMIRELIARELSTRARQDGFETLAEADDFEIEEDELEGFLTAYEFKPMQEEGSVDLGDLDSSAPSSPVDPAAPAAAPANPEPNA